MPRSALPCGACTQAAAVDHQVGLASGSRGEVGRFARGVPVQVHAQAGQGFFQGGQQLAVVQLAFARQVHALLEAALQGRLHVVQALGAQALQRGQAGVDAVVFLEQAAQAVGIGHVLAVPDHQGAVLLEEDMARPAAQSARASA